MIKPHKKKIIKLINVFRKYVLSKQNRFNKLYYNIIFKKYCLELKLPMEFLNKLQQTKIILHKDLQTYFVNDPSCEGVEEVIMLYPGFDATLHYRLAHLLNELKVKFYPRMISEIAHSKYGIDIHPSANISEGLFIDHGTGVVIGSTTIIDSNVRIYHGVTLGALNLSEASKLKNVKRHPTIGKNCILYCDAKILGGQTVVGDNCIIGCGVILTKSLPSNSKVICKNI